MNTTFLEIVRRLENHGAPTFKLRTGAAAADLDALEFRTGFPLPAPLRECYLLSDGETLDEEGPVLGLFCDYEFLPLEEVGKSLDRWSELRAFWEQPGMDDPLEFKSHPADSVKAVLSRPGWVPFAGHYSENHLAIDMDPAPAGVAGQVINFGRDDEHHFQIARSFEEFLKLVLDHYRRGEWNQHLGHAEWSLYDELRLALK